MIVDEIVASTRKRVALLKKQIDLDEYRNKAVEMAEQEACNSQIVFPFEEQLKREGMNVICEVKKASPSKGLIAKEFPYVSIAKEYEKAGAACISVLTEPEYFKGCSEYLSEIRKEASIPLLRKDFIIDPIQIYEAKLLGADCVLLICGILTKNTLMEYKKLCDRLHLSALIEAHNEEEVKMALEAGARIIGVNNRNLKDFTVDFNNSIRLRKLVGEEILFVAESGVKTPEDMKRLYDANVNGVLIGETLMRQENKKAALLALKALVGV